MPKAIFIPKRALYSLYVTNKQGSYSIARKFNCSQALVMKKLKGYGIPTRNVQEAHALAKPTYSRKNFSKNPLEKAYLIGFRLGDLYVSKTHPKSPTIRVSTNSTISAQLELVKKLFSP